MRTSLFPRDFSLQSASDDQRRRFHAAIAIASSNPELTAQVRAGALPGVTALYEARARSRSVPRSLFAAAALATPDGEAPSLRDVEVQRGRAQPHAEGDAHAWQVSSRAVFHADAVTLYRRDQSTRGFEAVRLGIPELVRRPLQEHRSGTRAQWTERLRHEGIDAEQADALVERLVDLGLLEAAGSGSEPGSESDSEPCALWNDRSAPPTRPLAQVAREAASVSETRATPPNAFATFERPVRMPAAIGHAQRVGELLLRLTRPEVPAIQRILARQLDGRWLPMTELERMAEGLIKQASDAEFRPDPADEPFVRWLAARALDAEIDLSRAPLPARQWSGTMLLGTQWTDEGHLLGPTLFCADPRELIGRYHLPGLPQRLEALDDPEALTVMLAYRGPGVLGEVAQVHAPGAVVLEYCGRASDGDRTLRLHDLEVTASSTRLYIRTRADQRPVTLVRPIPFNDALPGLHPLVCLLSMVASAQRPSRSLIDVALEGLPVRPRITFEGHVLSRRRARVPRELTEEGLIAWLDRVGLAGSVTVDSASGGLPLDPRVDDAVRQDLFKRLRRGERLAVSERLSSEGLTIDGRRHAAHALVPITVTSTEAPTRVPRVPRPTRPGALRGPFRTLRVNALAERMPTVLRRLGEGLDRRPFFYVFMSDAAESELRLRVPAHDDSGQRALTDVLDGLLDARIIRHWAVEPYVREWDRYGGARDIEAVEALFVADSASLYEPCASLPLVDERRTNLYALAIVQTMSCAGLDQAEQLALCRRAFDAYAQEFGYDREDRRAVGQMWRTRRDALVSAAGGHGDAALHDVLVQRRRNLGAWLDPANRQRLRKHLRSVIHMTGTRLHFRHNRSEEAWAYFFARNLLDRWRHLPHEAQATQAWRQ